MITTPLYYITPDPARSLGPEYFSLNYHIVCFDDSPLVDIIKKRGIKIFSLKREAKIRKIEISDKYRNSGKILSNKLTLDYIKKTSRGKLPAIMFFKPSLKLDIICNKNGFLKVGNSVKLNRLFEDKIKFFILCQKFKLPVSKGLVGRLGLLDFSKLKKELGLPLVLQFGRGWAGSTTFFVSDNNLWQRLNKVYFQKQVKVSQYINGFTYLNNACITQEQILISSPAIQLPSIPGFKGNKAATYGRQWPAIGLNLKIKNEITKITGEVGKIMSSSGYKGWFGLDFLYDPIRKKLFLSENNARLTASTSFYTQLEIKNNIKFPMLYWHILSFLNKNEKVIWQKKDIKGSQIVLRNYKNKKLVIKSAPKNGAYDKDTYISTPKAGDNINPTIEMATIDSLHPALNSKGEYEEWVINCISFINLNLLFK